MAIRTTVQRLNWGCGSRIAPGWINSDRLAADGVDVTCDIRRGLPLESNSLDYAVSIHALQDLAYLDIPPVLGELRRVLKPQGVLRLGLPDLDRAIQAYLRRDAQYFYVPDEDAASLGGKLVAQLTWYGSVRTPLTYDCVEELLHRASFRRVTRCPYRGTAGAYPDIVELDNRERESFFVEGCK